MPSLSVITKISRTIMLSYCFLSRQLHQAFKKGNQLVYREKKKANSPEYVNKFQIKLKNFKTFSDHTLPVGW